MTGAGAKGGFDNESELRKLFEAFDPVIFPFVDALGYDLNSLSKIKATKYQSRHKPDLKLDFVGKNGTIIGTEKVSVKLQSGPSGFNQVDRGWVEDRYRKLWPTMSDDVVEGLKLFTGQDEPLRGTRNSKRMFMDELPSDLRDAVLDFFSSNLRQIVSDVLAGRDENRADWFLVTDKSSGKSVVRPMDNVIAGATFGGVGLTPRGSIRLGRLTAQRKGGDGGAETAKNLQFKANPIELIKAAN